MSPSPSTSIPPTLPPCWPFSESSPGRPDSPGRPPDELLCEPVEPGDPEEDAVEPELELDPREDDELLPWRPDDELGIEGAPPLEPLDPTLGLELGEELCDPDDDEEDDDEDEDDEEEEDDEELGILGMPELEDDCCWLD